MRGFKAEHIIEYIARCLGYQITHADPLPDRIIQVDEHIRLPPIGNLPTRFLQVQVKLQSHVLR